MTEPNDRRDDFAEWGDAFASFAFAFCGVAIAVYVIVFATGDDTTSMSIPTIIARPVKKSSSIPSDGSAKGRANG